MTPLFPLQAVLFPGGLLRLKVFEARYLDLIADCLRERQPFGVGGGDGEIGTAGISAFAGADPIQHVAGGPGE